MNLSDRVKSFEILGERLRRFHENAPGTDMSVLVEAARMASHKNPWFTPEHIRIALNNLGHTLSAENLVHWLSHYDGRVDCVSAPRNIGVVMAGNIPAVGFHDFLCVLISGNKLTAKLSSSDDQLLPAMATILTDYLPEWHDFISFTSGKLDRFDAIIATGNSNTSRYFEFYFGRYPHIIRKNRNSIAVLDGNESLHDLQNLAADIMLYFGMGCRSISKILVPAGYNFVRIIEALSRFDCFSNHNKYRNNYEYFKSIFMVGQVPFIDTGFMLLKEDPDNASRIAVLHYEYYHKPEDLAGIILPGNDSVQCVISNMTLPVKVLRFGEGQNPALWDYADQVDTMEFLLSWV